MQVPDVWVEKFRTPKSPKAIGGWVAPRCPLKLPKGWRYVIDSNEAAIHHHGYDIRPAVVRKIQGPGDYTIECDEFAGDLDYLVERKSFENILGEVTQGRERWERSLLRMLDVRCPCVVVEGSLPGLLKGDYKQTRVSPQSVVGSIFAWSQRYRVPVWFADNRSHGRLLTQWWLAQAAHGHSKGKVVVGQVLRRPESE